MAAAQPSAAAPHRRLGSAPGSIATCNRQQLQRAIDNIQKTACNRRHATDSMQQTTDGMQQTTDGMQQTAYTVQQAAWNVRAAVPHHHHVVVRIGSAVQCCGILCSPAARLPLTRPTLIVVGEADKVRQSPYNGHSYRYNGHSYP